MVFQTLSPDALRDISNMLGLNKDMEGARQQCQQYRAALVEISNLIKNLKSDRTIKIHKLFGGNLMMTMDNKDIIKDLQDRKHQVEVSLNGIEEQIKHREDTLMETFHKVYEHIKNILPEDMK